MTAFRPQPGAQRCRPVPSHFLFVLLAVLRGCRRRRRRSPFSRPWTCFRSSGRAILEISPDGTQVAYASGAPLTLKTGQAPRSDRLIGRDGDDHRPLAGSEAEPVEPALVAGRARGSPSLRGLTPRARRSTCTGSRRTCTARVSEPARRAGGLAWSPDGRQLAFADGVPAKREPLKVKLPDAEGRDVGGACSRRSDRMVYRADGEGYLPDAFGQVIRRAGGWRRAAATHGRRLFDHDDVALGRRMAARSWPPPTGTRIRGRRSRMTARSMRSTSRSAQSVR